VSNSVALTKLDCCYNLLGSLDVSKNPALIFLDCRDNRFDKAAIEALFATLPVNRVPDGEYFQIYYNSNPGTESADRSIAEARGWTPQPEFEPPPGL